MIRDVKEDGVAEKYTKVEEVEIKVGTIIEG